MAKNKELEEFGRRVKEFRLQKRLSQQELADRVGYKGKDMISRIESGQTNIPMPKAIEIAQALGVKISDLTLRKDEPDRTLPPGGFHGGSTRPDLIPVIENLKELDPSDVARVKQYIEVLRSAKLWQQLNGTGKDGGSGSVSTGKLDPSRVQFLDAEDAKKWRDVQGTAEDYLTWLTLTSPGTDTSKK